MVLAAKIIVLMLHCASSVRISSKLDFGESSSARPVFKTGNYQEDFVLSPNFRNRDSINHKVDCVGNYCETSKPVKSDSSLSASSDVIVHVKTRVDASNTTTDHSVADVPIIVGTKDSSLYPKYFPTNVHSNYPAPSVGVEGGLEFGNDGFVPEGQFEGFNGYNVPRFHDNNGRIPPLNWYPQARVGEENVHNPLEFKKTYKNIWPSGFVNELGSLTNKRQANPTWVPCLCENQPLGDFPIARKLQQWIKLSEQ